jgi:hypothetical protein
VSTRPPLLENSLGEVERAEKEREEYIFIASSCSFLGTISSMCGARRGYVVTSWLRIARWTEDLTLLFEPGEMLLLSVEECYEV